MKIAEMEATLIDSMGTDLSCVNAARVSFAKESDFEYNHHIQLNRECEWVAIDGTTGWEEYQFEGGIRNGETTLRKLKDGDKKLVNYLAKHKHITPFMHCFATFRMKAPLFVARQLVKHQIGLSWNEESRRYIDEEPEFWFPKEWRARPEGSIKQGSGVATIQLDKRRFSPESIAEGCLLQYESLLEQGVAPEQARMVLPLNTMTNWIWSGSLAAWARVANLRLDPHAQKECQDIVKFIDDICAYIWPVSWAALRGE